MKRSSLLFSTKQAYDRAYSKALGVIGKELSWAEMQ